VYASLGASATRTGVSRSRSLGDRSRLIGVVDPTAIDRMATGIAVHNILARRTSTESSESFVRASGEPRGARKGART
jgi:hypothetical protein